MRPSIFASVVIALPLLAACVQQEPPPLPTINPLLLTVTPAPTATPQATYTPPPTAQRMPSRTPYPAYAPLITPGTLPAPTLTLAAAGPPAAVPSTAPTALPSATPTGYTVPSGGASPLPDLMPILTFSSDAMCSQWLLAQIGVVNRGTGPAGSFTVEWSFGWGEPQRVVVADGLGEHAGQYYFFNGQTAVHCLTTVTLTAWVRVDVENTVAELDEQNNNEEETYTVMFLTATP